MNRHFPILDVISRRLTAVEARLQDTTFEHQRESVASRLERRRILEHLGIAAVTPAEIDAAFHEEV